MFKSANNQISDTELFHRIQKGDEKAFTIAYELYNKFYLDHGLAWEPDIEVATSDLILPMVKNSLGLGFIPAEFAQEALSKGEIIEIQLVEKTLDRTICLIQDTHHGLCIAARAMRDLLVEQVK